MTYGAIEHFSGRASSYEVGRRRLVPGYAVFYGTATDALDLARRDIQRVLDLGAGTGVFAAHIAAVIPTVELTLLDGSALMLEQARSAFGDRAQYVLADLSDPLPEHHTWDAIVSALAIHHLEDDAKRELFTRVHAALASGGVFVNAEQVAGPTASLEHAYGRWHERRARELGTSDSEWQAALQSMSHDRTATVEHQLAWLREAGFVDADCIWKDHRFAVLVARRAD